MTVSSAGSAQAGIHRVRVRVQLHTYYTNMDL